MKKRNTGVLVVPLLISLCCSNNSYAWNNQNTPGQNFVTGVCAVGAAVLGAVGAVALADWCFSETDEQLITRFDRECSNFDYQYNDMMNYLEQALGVYSFPVDSLMFFRNSPEIVLYEIATRINNKGVSQQTYRNNVASAKNQLKSSMSTLYKRIHALERKNCNYDEQKRLQAMRKLAHSAEKLINHATFFADYLEHHKSYFNVYEIISILRDSYAQCFAIVEQAGIYAEINLKNGIIGAYSGRYPLRNFINTIEPDISRLRSGINLLKYNYEVGRQYANTILNELMWMRNVVVADSRYQQECYQWEHERLQKLHIEALEAQARAERERANALREQNRILRDREADRAEDLFRRRMYGMCDNSELDVTVVVNL